MTTHVFSLRRLPLLFSSDALNVTRDPTLLFAICFSIVPAIAGFFFRDAIDAAALGYFGVANLFAMIVPIFICLPAFMVGWVTGFLFLEDRDDGPLLALEVTPVGKRGFMAYRVAVTAAISFVITLLGAALLLPERGVAMALVLATMVALDAVGSALILPALARNKVEGLALTKVTNIFGMVPLVALVPGPWRFVGGVVPTFWVGEVILNAGDFPSWHFLAASAIGIGLHLAAVALLYRLQANRAG
ncbi:MAG: hypothetical protein KKH72_07005 [Alphaproteobacteria bacterium]|nr:hypothetical protein [Alphaproteobacteria bacterium]